MTEITEVLLQQIAGDLERLLVEDRENVNFAYRKTRRIAEDGNRCHVLPC